MKCYSWFLSLITLVSVFQISTKAGSNGERANRIYDEASRNRNKAFKHHEKSENWKKLSQAVRCPSLSSFCQSKVEKHAKKMETKLTEAESLKRLSEIVRKPPGNSSSRRSLSGSSYSQLSPIDENVQYHSKSV